mmetsp:Transcript_1744/g.2827  ORF Transcript_1744/g.2827 Transcript_1744/m.2827 type:complete len:445 (+) Transcript_1744:273-1607(+)|eukprot:CAMPEP_0184294836 /NCGR_PEP_ID=MMETSP1049-20130417/5919_1 /TAXON_ID=77928 /ORGANISM="Proteomonas sulcata, Strain CCMP704" /LENGTH=444 /DNA_ID=CAMNT_0026603243 /DNA_START=39 /DNA_END=1373 /DNA_ORIENTATION=-
MSATADLIYLNNENHTAGAQWIQHFQNVNKRLSGGANGPKLDPEPIVVDFRPSARPGASPEPQPHQAHQTASSQISFHSTARSLAQHFESQFSTNSARRSESPAPISGRSEAAKVSILKQQLGNKELEVSNLVQEVARLQSALQDARTRPQVVVGGPRSKDDQELLKGCVLDIKGLRKEVSELRDNNEILRANNEILRAQNLAYATQARQLAERPVLSKGGCSCGHKKDAEIGALKAQVLELKTEAAQRSELPAAQKVASEVEELLHQTRMAYIELEEFKMDKRQMIQELMQYREAILARNEQIESLHHQNVHLQQNLEKAVSENSVILQQKHQESRRLPQNLAELQMWAKSGYDVNNQTVIHVDADRAGVFTASTPAPKRGPSKRAPENLSPTPRRHSHLSVASTVSHNSRGSSGPASPITHIVAPATPLAPGPVPNVPYLFV